MTISKFTLSSLFFLSVNLSPLVPQVMAQASKDPVVATVNGAKILMSQLNDYYEKSLLFPSHRKITRKGALQELINKELGAQKAKKANLQNDPVVADKINDILYHAQISRDLEDKLKKITVSDKEVADYYKNNKEYRTSQILLRLKAVPTPEEVEGVLAKAIEISNELKSKPKKFEELAKEHTQMPNAAAGGDVGFQPPTSYPAESFEAINGKDVGFITKPVRTQFGYHIIKVTGVKDFKKINKTVYKKIIYDIKRDKIIENYFDGLQKKADIKISEKYIK